MHGEAKVVFEIIALIVGGLGLSAYASTLSTRTLVRLWLTLVFGGVGYVAWAAFVLTP